MTENRYAFAGGNPIDNIEFDGHIPGAGSGCPTRFCGDNTGGNKTGNNPNVAPGQPARKLGKVATPQAVRTFRRVEAHRVTRNAITTTRVFTLARPSRGGFLAGVGEAAADFVDAATHPKRTAQGALNSLLNPDQTVEALISSCDDRTVENCFGYVLAGILGGKGAKQIAGRGAEGPGADAGKEGLEGLSRSYIDITKGGSIRNVGTNATYTEFAEELTRAGWASRTSKDGAVQIFSRDGAKYVLRSKTPPATQDGRLTSPLRGPRGTRSRSGSGTNHE